MDGPTGLLICGAAVAALVDWWAVRRADKRLEYFAKPAVMVFLIAAAVTLDPADPTRRWWFVVALAFSLLGDFFLMLPDRFVPGLAAFLVAHLAYIAGFHFRPPSPPSHFLWTDTTLAGLAAAVVIFGTVTFLIGRRVVRGAKRLDSKLGLPVGVYMVVITVMVAKAVADGSVFAAAGALFFYASDALIGFNRFVAPQRWMPLAIIVSYHLAQIGLVVSLTG